ncbi:MAG: hypothetical protein FJY65_04000 [Calditrichaeota bacterium]|nr:hypothetical protein [Calditrichota bacterium]
MFKNIKNKIFISIVILFWMSVEAAGQSGTMIIVSANETNVAIFLDGDYIDTYQGQSLKVLVSPGKHMIEARKKDYSPDTKEITVPADEVVPVKFILQRAGSFRTVTPEEAEIRHGVGILTIRTLDDGWKVQIDGDPRVIEIPATLKEVSAGEHKLIIMRQGEIFEKNIRIPVDGKLVFDLDKNLAELKKETEKKRWEEQLNLMFSDSARLINCIENYDIDYLNIENNINTLLQQIEAISSQIKAKSISTAELSRTINSHPMYKTFEFLKNTNYPRREINNRVNNSLDYNDIAFIRKVISLSNLSNEGFKRKLYIGYALDKSASIVSGKGILKAVDTTGKEYRFLIKAELQTGAIIAHIILFPFYTLFDLVHILTPLGYINWTPPDNYDRVYEKIRTPEYGEGRELLLWAIYRQQQIIESMPEDLKNDMSKLETSHNDIENLTNQQKQKEDQVLVMKSTLKEMPNKKSEDEAAFKIICQQLSSFRKTRPRN